MDVAVKWLGDWILVEDDDFPMADGGAGFYIFGWVPTSEIMCGVQRDTTHSSGAIIFCMGQQPQNESNVAMANSCYGSLIPTDHENILRVYRGVMQKKVQ